MAVFSTSDAKVMMPRNLADGMIAETKTTSTVAGLSMREPMRFGEVDYITFNEFPKAEFVEEGADKASTTGKFGAVTAKPHKAQVTMRFNEEVQWADEDYQLGIFRELAGAGQVALSRALDLGLYHRINPLTGEVITSWDNYVTKTAFTGTLGSGEADQVIRTTAGLLINQAAPVSVNGIAIDPRLTFELANLQTKNADGSESGVQRYPNLGLGTGINNFMGINTMQGDTVGGGSEAPNSVRAIIGDFQNGIRWGIQRELPVELIRYGDPDGQGDLKRKNQIALRMEIVYGWYVFENKFAVVKAAA